MIEDKENCALVGKSSKAKGKKGQGEAESSEKVKKGQGEAESSEKGKKKDLSKIKSFHCHEFVHYASKCLNQKKKKSSKDHVVASAEVNVF